jgi:hypothetical protein
MASPAEIVQACLVALDLVIVPMEYNELVPFVQQPGDGSTVCYISSMPDDDDQAVCVKNSIGLDFGQTMNTGKYIIHPGIQIEVRSLYDSPGYALTQKIANAIQGINNNTVVFNGQTYYVQNIYRVGSIVTFGEQVGKRRRIWVIPARLVMADSQSTIG